MGKRLRPRQASTEVTTIVLIVAAAAKGSHLSRSPPFAGHSTCCSAVIAEPAGIQSAINAGTKELSSAAPAEHFHFLSCTVRRLIHKDYSPSVVTAAFSCVACVHSATMIAEECELRKGMDI